MPIFRKIIKREAHATVAIEADTQEKADEIFNDWLEDDKGRNSDSLNEILNEGERDTEEWLLQFANMDTYNRSPIVDDILIEKKPPKEPKYDLYITYKDNSGKRTAFLESTLSNALYELTKLDTEYILRAKGYPSKECLDEARKHDATIIWFEAERRK